MRPVIKLMRPHQYLKNGFVFLGPLFAHQWNMLTLSQALLVFLAFCSMASAVYIMNDLVDIEADRAHPIKRHRCPAVISPSAEPDSFLSACSSPR